jgi:putative membrane protein
MPSEIADGRWHRLPPLTLLFAVGSRLYASRALLLPAGVAVFVSRGGSRGWSDYDGWLLVPAVGLLALELVQYFTLAYRLDPQEIAITRGLFWKRERHIPYARIQNVELVQHAAHRLAGVAVVRLDTGTGAGAEGELSVLSLDAVRELREAVRIGRREAPDAAAPDAAAGSGPTAAPPPVLPSVLAAPSLRELALHGLLTSRGLVVVAAIAGAFWQFDLDDWVFGYLPSAARVWDGAGGFWSGVRRASPLLVAELALAVVFAAAVLRLLSAAWSAIKHYEFTLTARGEELFQSYGLLTRVGRTIPRARIQKLTVTQEWLMRRLRRATVTVETAASAAPTDGEPSTHGSQVLVPIVGVDAVAPLLRAVSPAGVLADAPDLSALDWQGVHPQAFTRLIRLRIAIGALIAIGSAAALGPWSLLAGSAAAALLVADAWISARFTAFAWSGDALIFRSGGLTRRTSLVRAGRMQAASIERSPFDRRWRMARVRVDTAGAATGGHHVDIPLLAEDVANALYARLRHAAAP